MTDRVGQQLGNYRLIRLLGQGGFAEVYLGEHVLLKTAAAIKVLHTQFQQTVIDSFLQEAQAIEQLRHSHIVRFLDFGQDSGDRTFFLVMEYAPHGSLRELHPRGQMIPLSTIVAYVKQVADALQHAHASKLIHCDIKPENMLLARTNEIIVGDFGLATIARHTSSQNMAYLAGTAIYMAPEQFKGKPRAASDQYALGVCVYEWLCGQPPFCEGTFIQLGYQHTHEAPPSLRDHVPTIPPEVEQVVLTALAKDPKDRFGSVQAFAIALTQAAQATPARAVPAQKPADPAPPTQRMQTLTHTNEMGPQTEGGHPPSASPPTSEKIPSTETPSSHPPSQTPPHPPTEQSETVTPPIVKVPHALPAGRALSRRQVLSGLAVLALAVAGGEVIWRHLSQSSSPLSRSSPTVSQNSPEGTLLYTYKGHSDFVQAVAWSPDGRRIASASDDNTVQVWNATDGSQVYTYKGHHTHAVETVAWSPDGKRIASGSLDKTVQVWQAG